MEDIEAQYFHRPMLTEIAGTPGILLADAASAQLVEKNDVMFMTSATNNRTALSNLNQCRDSVIQAQNFTIFHVRQMQK